MCFGGPGDGEPGLCRILDFQSVTYQDSSAEDTQWHLLGEDSPDDTRTAGPCYRVF
jgi:hypothetical protein